MTVPITVFAVVVISFVLNFTPVESQELHSKSPGPKKTFRIDSAERLNWHGALFHCMSKNGLLASVESADEQQELVNLIKNSGIMDSFWLGGNDLANEGSWKWSQEKVIKGFTNWSTNEPSSNGNANLENCLIMVKDWNYQWNDYICSKAHSFICEYKTEIRSEWPPASAVEKKFYLEMQIKGDWHSTYMHCLRNNSRLARIENKEENDIVVDMIKQANLGFDIQYWLGAMDFPEVGLYFWLSTGLPVRGYSNWHAGQGLAEDQRCLAYWQSSQYVVKWNDFICSTLYPFVCEYYE